VTSQPSSSVLPRSTPEGQGIDSAQIAALLDALEDAGVEMHSLMVVRGGHVVAEGWWAPYQQTGLHLLYSLSKSFTSTAVGFAVSEGLLSVDEPVISIFPELVPADAAGYIRQMKVRDVLSMATGHREDTLERISSAENMVAAFLALSPEEEPGTWFTYNNGATLMLSAMVAKVTGQRLLDFLRPRLLAPLGITDAYWQGIENLDYGFSGLHLATESIAKFGQLYLRRGSWQGRQLIPADWVAEATRTHVDNPREPEVDWRQGYGYQFWMCRHHGYRGDGAYGQFCVVLPDRDTVIAVTAGNEDMQAILDAIWTQLLPALNSVEALPVSQATDDLRTRLHALNLPFPAGERRPATDLQPDSWVQGEAVGERAARVQIRSIKETDDGWLLTMADDRAEYVVSCGYRGWIRTELEVSEGHRLQTAAAAAWTGPSTFTVEVAFVQTPHRVRITCDASSATTRAEWNVVPLSGMYIGQLAVELARL
jgi:CubicO group peptidase (beta-lactamase class C family)